LIFYLLLLVPLLSWGSLEKCSEVPSFSLRNMQGEMKSVESIIQSTENKIIILSFFQTTCVPCVREIGDLLKAQKDIMNEKTSSFELVLISSKEDKQVVNSFINKHNFKTKYILNDPNGKLDANYNIKSIPFIVIVNKKGKVLEDLRGQVLSKIRDSLGFKELIEKNIFSEKCI
jgi:thioredoxin-related protein